MIEEPKKTIAYLCPACRRPVLEERSVFSLSGDRARIACPCGGSQVRIEGDGTRYMLTVPCLPCGGEHTVACSAQAFLRERALAFACAASGMDCCYAGDAAVVAPALRRLAEAMEKLDPAADTGFLDEMVLQEVLSELRDIARRGGISCACGCADWRLDVNIGSVDVICAACGAAVRIPAATVADIEDICCKDRLLLGKRGPGA